MGFFSGKVVLITGASSGIGKATALALAQQGATVGLMARRREELEMVASQMGGKGIVLVADVTDESAVQHKIKELVGITGGLDIPSGALCRNHHSHHSSGNGGQLHGYNPCHQSGPSPH